MKHRCAGCGRPRWWWVLGSEPSVNSRLVGGLMMVVGVWGLAWGLTTPVAVAALGACGVGVILSALGISLVCEQQSREGKRTRYKKG